MAEIMSRAVAALRPAARKLPPGVKRSLRGAAGLLPARIRRRLGIAGGRGPRLVRWGSLRRAEPFDRNWGYARGTPVDRIYIEKFIEASAPDIKGACLEVLNSDYTRRYGGDRVTSSDVLDIDPENTSATVVADLQDPDSLPSEAFDCFILTQTLHLIDDMDAALRNAWQSLRPGGVLLLTVPVLGKHSAHSHFEKDRWRITPAGMEWMLLRLPGASVETASFGNLRASVAHLYGLAAEDLRPKELEAWDPEYPVTVAARAVKADV